MATTAGIAAREPAVVTAAVREAAVVTAGSPVVTPCVVTARPAVVITSAVTSTGLRRHWLAGLVIDERLVTVGPAERTARPGSAVRYQREGNRYRRSDDDDRERDHYCLLYPAL